MTRSPGGAALVAGVVVLAAVLAWGIVQPLRSTDSDNAAFTAAARGDTAAALTDAREAQASDPVSVDPLWLQAAIYRGAGGSGRRPARVDEGGLDPAIEPRDVAAAGLLRPAAGPERGIARRARAGAEAGSRPDPDAHRSWRFLCLG